MSASSNQGMFSVQDFLESIGEQLDRAQDNLAIKARAGRPLTWALKDLSIDLKVFVEMDPSGELSLRTAGANEEGASTMHLSLTTITRSMVEENTWALQKDVDPRPLTKLDATSSLDPTQRRKLARMGVRTVGQLKRLADSTPGGQLEAMAGIPALNLRAMLEAAARPAVLGVDTVPSEGGRHYLRVQGVNLADGNAPEVHLAGEPVEVLSSDHNELVVRPLEHHSEGQVEVFVGENRATSYFRLPQRRSSNGRPAAPPREPELDPYGAVRGHGYGNGGAA